MTEEKYDIYLSYSYQDKYWVSQFAKVLEDAGLTTWSGTATNLSSRKLISEHIQKALRESTTLIVILSPNSIKSKWTFFEWGAAFADQKLIIPILIGDVDVKDIPVLKNQFHFLLRGLSPAETGRQVAEELVKINTALAQQKDAVHNDVLRLQLKKGFLERWAKEK